VLFIRAQSTIRAEGAPSAQVCHRSSIYPDRLSVVDAPPLRAPRANRVFRTDEKRIRTKNTVIDKSKGGLGWLLYKIADCVRMAFHPHAIGDPRGRAAVRARATTRLGWHLLSILISGIIAAFRGSYSRTAL